MLLSSIVALLASTAAPVPSGAQEAQHALRGRVMTSEGEPVKAFRVRARADVADGPGSRRRVEISREVDSAEGLFALEELPGGSWRLEVDAEGHAAVLFPRLRLAEGAPLEPLKIVLYREARIGGQVLDARTGEPLKGARVSARLHLDHAKVAPLESLPAVLTAEDGTFVLAGFSPATWELRVEKEGHVAQEGPRFDPLEGQTVGSFVARLGVGGTVEGCATREDKSVLAGAEVLVVDMRGVAGRAVTGEDGGFLIPLVRPGRYRVEVRALQEDGGVGPVELAGQVLVQEGERVLVTLRRPPR